MRMRLDTYEPAYDVAQICLNGHLINEASVGYPDSNQEFCSKCGVKTIRVCQSCSARIRGAFRDSYIPENYVIPAFCSACGQPFPWTSAKIQTAHELAQELENISDEEKKILEQSIDEIVKDTPKTTLAATRFKKILFNTSKPVVDAFRDILVDIASETAKKLLWP